MSSPYLGGEYFQKIYTTLHAFDDKLIERLFTAKERDVVEYVKNYIDDNTLYTAFNNQDVIDLAEKISQINFETLKEWGDTTNDPSSITNVSSKIKTLVDSQLKKIITAESNKSPNGINEELFESECGLFIKADNQEDAARQLNKDQTSIGTCAVWRSDEGAYFILQKIPGFIDHSIVRPQVVSQGSRLDSALFRLGGNIEKFKTLERCGVAVSDAHISVVDLSPEEYLVMKSKSVPNAYDFYFKAPSGKITRFLLGKDGEDLFDQMNQAIIQSISSDSPKSISGGSISDVEFYADLVKKEQVANSEAQAVSLLRENDACFPDLYYIFERDPGFYQLVYRDLFGLIQGPIPIDLQFPNLQTGILMAADSFDDIHVLAELKNKIATNREELDEILKRTPAGTPVLLTPSPPLLIFNETFLYINIPAPSGASSTVQCIPVNNEGELGKAHRKLLDRDKQLEWLRTAANEGAAERALEASSALEDYRIWKRTEEQYGLVVKEASGKLSEPLISSQGDELLEWLEYHLKVRSLAKKLLEKVQALKETSETLPQELSQLKNDSLYSHADGECLYERAKKYVEANQDLIKARPDVCIALQQVLIKAAEKMDFPENLVSAVKARCLAASLVSFSDTHPLHDMTTVIERGADQQTNKLYGAHFHSLDGSILKRGCMRSSRQDKDGQEEFRFVFKIAHQERERLKHSLTMIKKNLTNYNAVLQEELISTISLVPRNNGKELEIYLPNIGKMIIGDNPRIYCEYNTVAIELDATLPPGEGLKKMQQMLSIIGSGLLLCESGPEDQKRMKVLQLFRAFYPREALFLERLPAISEVPVEALMLCIKEEVPEMESIFLKYLDPSSDLMKVEEIFPGRKIWSISDVGEQLRQGEAYGLVQGLNSKEDVCTIIKNGALNSQDRLNMGIGKKGASSETDISLGGGDHVFTRLIGHNNIESTISDFSLSLSFQILYDLDVIGQGAYGYPRNEYGAKKGSLYRTRTGIPNFADFDRNNEIMVSTRIDPKFIRGVVVINEEFKKEIIDSMRKEGLLEEVGGDEYILGKKVDDFVHIRHEGRYFHKDWWSNPQKQPETSTGHRERFVEETQ